MSEGSADPVPDLEVLLVTGMSGAGRTTAAHVLEDLGWYVVDNLPPSLLPRLADLGERTRGAVPKIAAVVDVRNLTFFSDLQAALESLRQAKVEPRIVFLEASDEALVRRFESVRRPHPLQGDRRVLDGIHEERTLLQDLRGAADILIDTSALNVHQLSAKVVDAFRADDAPRLRATLMSFGYKYGLPVDADLVIDCRFLPNPHWVPELRPLTGRDDRVSEYVFAQPGAQEFADRFTEWLEVVIDGYEREGKRYATIAVGCTGGKHRSVAMTEHLARRIGRGSAPSAPSAGGADSGTKGSARGGIEARVIHRDLGRE